MIHEDKGASCLKSIMNRVCTTPKLYQDIPLAVMVMLYSVCVATSECGIESLISSVSESNKKNRPLAIPQLHAELTIKENGPAPLSKSCNDFLYQSLTRHFGGGPEKWSFCKISSQHCPAKSIVISRLIRDAPEPKLT